MTPRVVFAFGRYVPGTTTRTLMRDGEVVVIGPRPPFALLFTSRPGEVIPKIAD